MDELNLTDEQHRIIQSDAHTLRTIAYAGTGKTTTSRLYTQKRPNDSFLYIAFNKSVQNEANRTFPDNTESRTAHSLAYGGYGLENRTARFPHRLDRDEPFSWEADTADKKIGGFLWQDNLTGYLPTKAIKQYFEDQGKETSYDVASIIADILSDRYFTSGFEEITLDHMTTFEKENLHNRNIPPAEILEDTKEVWATMLEPEDESIPMTHDGYLKFYQIMQPDFTHKTDKIIFDEAQDADPTTANIVANQPVPTVYVGDPYQQIYGWRGAIDAMSDIDADETKYLTKSWRFGEDIARLSTDLLNHFKDIKKPVRGNEQVSSSVNRYDHHYAAKPGEETVLHRSYAACVRTAEQNMEQDNTLHWIGGVDNYELTHLADLYHFREGDYRSIDNYGKLSRYNDFDEYAEIAEIADDHQRQRNVDLVDDYDDELPELIAKIKDHSTRAPERADVRLTTAHRAKGCEFEYVTLCDDFPDYTDDLEELAEENMPVETILNDRSFQEEINLLYVAMTRTQTRLNIPRETMDFIQDPLKDVKTPERRIHPESIYANRSDCESYFSTSESGQSAPAR